MNSKVSSTPEKISSSQTSRKKDGGVQKFFEVDTIFECTSQYGWYQFYMVFVIQYMMFNSAGNCIFISFASLKPICHDNINEVFISDV